MKIVLTLLSFLPLSLILPGCSGGMIGTGTGPKDDNKIVVAQATLPEKLSPRMPLTLLNEAARQARALQREANSNDSGQGSEQRIAESWLQLSPLINKIETHRLDLHEELMLLDSVFDEVLRYCRSSEESSCVVPPGAIVATYTPEIVAALLQVADSSEQTEYSVFENTWRQHLHESLGLEFSFGTIDYSVEKGGPFSLTLEPLSLSTNLSFSMQWTEKLDDVRYRLINVLTGSESLYRYTKRAAKERLALRQNLELNKGSSLEITSSAVTDGEFLLTATVDEKRLIGKADGLKAQFLLLDREVQNTEILQESFSRDGIASEVDECRFTSESDDCSDYWNPEAYNGDPSTNQPLTGDPDPDLPDPTEGEGGENGSPENNPDPSESEPGEGEPGEGEPGEAGQHENRFRDITVKSLPDWVEFFDIVSSATEYQEGKHELFCSGWRVDFAEYVEVSCFVDAETALNGIVLAFDTFGNGTLLADAEIVYRVSQ